MTLNTIESTRARMRTHRGKYNEISTLAGISLSWVKKFSTGARGSSPSFEQMQRLIQALDELERRSGVRGIQINDAAASTFLQGPGQG